MFKKAAQDLARTHLDKRLQAMKKVDIMHTPPRGWIILPDDARYDTCSARLGSASLHRQWHSWRSEKSKDRSRIATLREALAALGVQSTHAVNLPCFTA